MSAINEAAFADPISRRLALGEQIGNEIWLDPRGNATVAVRNGGMINPVRHDIAPARQLYRFASQSDGVEKILTGGWWLERHELDHLIRFADVNHRTLGYAVRLLCCVPAEWGSALNFLISARSRGTLAAWHGLANSAVGAGAASLPGGATRTPITAQNDVAAWRIAQLFIPGLREPGAGGRCFSDVQQWQTEGAPDWLIGSGG